jgi:DNA-binding NarL/FixJ family response regulator
VARRLKIEGSKTRIVFLSVATDIDQVTACFAAGGDAYVSKTSILTDLIYAINEVLAGRTFVSAEISFS